MNTTFHEFSLSSDTWSPAHPEVLAAICAANTGYAEPYGEDALSEQARGLLRGLFGEGIDIYFAWGGTGANVLALAAGAGPSAGVVCTDTAHINVHESAAPERLAGVKLLASQNTGGKLLPEDIKSWAVQQADHHCAFPEMLSISQTTELGSVYTVDEVRTLCRAAHSHGMAVHMDGARFANAVAALGCTPAALTREAGVDILCLGGTKNGFAFGEAVLVFSDVLKTHFAHLHKQYLQLAAKNRYVAAQFAAAFAGDLWLQNARQANAMAARLAKGVAAMPGFSLDLPAQSNQLFLHVPPALTAQMEALTGAAVERDGATRWVTSFCHTKEHIDAFLAKLHRL